MRISWYIYIPLCLIVPILTLYLCIHDKDTIVPPTPEITAESIRIWKKDNPTLKRTKLSAIPAAATAVQKTAQQSTPSQTTTPPTPELETKLKPRPPYLARIPEISPALNSLVQQNLNTTQLTTYAEQMLSNDKPQLARIAYERVIDCAKDATVKDRKFAARAIAKLRDETPLWNPDPTTRKKLNVNITLNNSYSKKSKALISQLEKSIFKSSDGILDPNIKITFTSDSQSSMDIGEDTQLVKFTLQSKSDLETKIPAALYYSISTRNNQSQKLISIPPIPDHISPQQALQTYITRLAWANAAP